MSDLSDIDEFIKNERRSQPQCNFFRSSSEFCDLSGNKGCEYIQKVLRKCPGEKEPATIFSRIKSIQGDHIDSSREQQSETNSKLLFPNGFGDEFEQEIMQHFGKSLFPFAKSFFGIFQDESQDTFGNIPRFPESFFRQPSTNMRRDMQPPPPPHRLNRHVENQDEFEEV